MKTIFWPTVAGLLCLTFQVLAQGGLSPGLYEYNGTVTMEGMPGGQPTAFSGKQCMTAQDLADGGQKALTSGSGGNNPCTFTNYSSTGSTATWNMSCQAQGYTMNGGGSASYNAGGYNVRSENLSQMMGMNIKTVTVFSGRRVGDCTQSTLGAPATVTTMAAAPAAPAVSSTSSSGSNPAQAMAQHMAVESTGTQGASGQGSTINTAVGLGVWAGSLAGVDPSTLSQVVEAKQIIDKITHVTSAIPVGNKAQVLAKLSPRNDGQGKFVLPFKRDGKPTEWASKALTASIAGAGAGMAADKATDLATSALAKASPWGGMVTSLFGGAAKEKAKAVAQDTGAAMALGGWDAIHAGSDTSFDDLDQMIVYMQGNFGLSTDFVYPVAASLALYPEMKDRFEPALRAYYGIN